MITIAFTGDLAFSPSIVEAGESQPAGWIWEDLTPSLRADITVGNFEFPFSWARNPQFEGSWEGYCAPENAYRMISAFPLDVYTLANNHAYDWGLEGIQTTRKLLGTLGGKVIGAGENLSGATQPAILKRNGICMGFLAYCASGSHSASRSSAGTAPLEISRVVADVEQLKQSVDHVVVLLHWGIEFSDYPHPSDIEKAHKIIDTGASAIIGHHPHVVQGVEAYRGRPIFYSLGNLIYDPYAERVFVRKALEARLQAIIARVTFSDHDVSGWRVIPFNLGREKRPLRMSADEEEAFYQRFQMLSQRIGQAGEAFYDQVVDRLLERELRTIWLLARRTKGKSLLKTLSSLRWRHYRVLFRYLVSRIEGGRKSA